MNKVIPQVGQAWGWDNWVDGMDTIASLSPNLVIWDGGSSTVIHDGKLSDRYTFKPANDLEWLAVNCNEIESRPYLFAYKWNDLVCYTNSRDISDKYEVVSVIIDKRNELFGVEMNKPKMKVEYEKCEFDKLSTAIAAMENGETLYYKATEGLKPFWVDLTAPSYGSVVANWEFLSRRIETEVTWQDELTDNFLNTKTLGDDHTFEEVINNEDLHAEFIAMCHLVASMTDKPE